MKNQIRKIVCTCLCLCVICGLASGKGYTNEVEDYSMTYRNNDVVFEGASGISITAGTFETNELSITSGQDPDGRNYVGQIHTLSSGKFTFEVGRSGSSGVASWFNARLSGYNDASVNGDRTTFDHTAGELNFAFLGDLTLTVTTADYPTGITVTFPGVALAQGPDGLSNNWWFGQRTGQHTRDSDGPNSLLAFGSDSEGNTVYASFLRGGNGTNVVTLNQLSIIGAAVSMPTVLPNVESAFGALPINGSLVAIDGFPGSYDPVSNHIQGYSQYTNAAGVNYALLTHSVDTADYAHIVAGPISNDTKWGFKTYLQGWRHPGGIQVMGDYLFVPSEQESTSQVALYDLRSLKVGELRRVETFNLSMNHKAGALGVTAYTDSNGISYYLMIVANLNGENSVYHVYRAPAANGIETASFVEVGSFAFSKDFQGFGLITEAATNHVYLVGLWSISEGASFADYAYLYQINTQNWTVGNEIQNIHMVSTGGGAGVLGVHFRYGAGVRVTGAQKLLVSATERNSVLGSDMDINNWSN